MGWTISSHDEGDFRKAVHELADPSETTSSRQFATGAKYFEIDRCLRLASTVRGCSFDHAPCVRETPDRRDEFTTLEAFAP